MANNVPVTPGAGATIAADEVTDPSLGLVKVQVVKFMSGEEDSPTRIHAGSGASANALRAVEAPYASVSAITPGTPVAAGRGVFINCSVAGNVALKFADATVLIVPVYVGPNLIDNMAIVDVVAGSTTATAIVTVLR
jgi:hypothetical protein